MSKTVGARRAGGGAVAASDESPDGLLLDLALSVRHRPAVVDPDATAHRILTEAIQLFATRGYAGTSMRDIASAVGIKAASIYSHFESKEKILEEALSQILYDFHAYIVDAVEVGIPAREQLQALIEQHIRWQFSFRSVAGSWDVLWDIETLRENLSRGAWSGITRRRERYHRLVQALIAASVPAAGNSRRTAEAVLTLSDRAPVWATAGEDDVSQDGLVKGAWATIEALLG